jgi:hypothetical protein
MICRPNHWLTVFTGKHGTARGRYFFFNRVGFLRQRPNHARLNRAPPGTNLTSISGRRGRPCQLHFGGCYKPHVLR